MNTQHSLEERVNELEQRVFDLERRVIAPNDIPLLKPRVLPWWHRPPYHKERSNG